MGKRKTTSGEGWTRVRFGDVVENVNDQPKRATLPLETRYIAGEHVDENRLTIDRWGTLGDDLVPPTFKRRFQPGDLLFHSRNLKKIAVPDFGGITGEKLFVLRSRSPLLLQEFVPYVLLSPAFTAYAEASWSGSVNKFLNWTPLARYEFDLPPIEKQRRGAEVFAAIVLQSETASAVKSSTSTAVDALLIEAVRHAPMVAVADLLEQGPQNGISPRVRDDGNFPTVPIGAVRDGVVNTSENLKWSRLDDDKYERFLLKSGDILCVRGNGNRSLVGRVGAVTENKYGCFYPDLLIRLRFHEDRILPDFAVAAWNSRPVHQSLIARAKSTNGIYKINGADIRAHSLPVPPISAQHTFLEYLSAMTQTANIASARARRSHALGKRVLAAVS